VAQRKNKSWSDLTGSQRALALAAGVVQISLLVGALVDIRRRPADQVRGSKPIWVAVSFVNFVGPLAYFRFGRRR
jgi:hypothetical protein